MKYVVTFVLIIIALIVGICIGVYGSALGFYQQIADGILIPAEDEYDNDGK